MTATNKEGSYPYFLVVNFYQTEKPSPRVCSLFTEGLIPKRNDFLSTKLFELEINLRLY